MMKRVLWVMFVFCLATSCGQAPQEIQPSTPEKVKIGKNDRHFTVVDDNYAAARFEFSLDNKVIGTTPIGGSQEWWLNARPGRHTISIRRISGAFKVERATIKVFSGYKRPIGIIQNNNPTAVFSYMSDDGKDIVAFGFQMVEVDVADKVVSFEIDVWE